MKLLRLAHLSAGLLFVAIFIATGQYMDLGYDHLRGMADGPRLLLRSAHIYLLLLALLNVLLGCYLRVHAEPSARRSQLLGSALILAAPALMTLSFFIEWQDESLVRPLSRTALYGVLIGAGLHFFSGLIGSKKSTAIPVNAVVRMARPTDKLEQLTQMYVDGLGFTILSRFQAHHGFDGVILGHPQQPWHLEFTHHRGTTVDGAPTKDNLLVFYVPDKDAWQKSCSALKAAGFHEVEPYNDYWGRRGKTFEDIEQYRVVIENDAWEK